MDNDICDSIMKSVACFIKCGEYEDAVLLFLTVPVGQRDLVASQISCDLTDPESEIWETLSSRSIYLEVVPLDDEGFIHPASELCIDVENLCKEVSKSWCYCASRGNADTRVRGYSQRQSLGHLCY